MSQSLNKLNAQRTWPLALVIGAALSFLPPREAKSQQSCPTPILAKNQNIELYVRQVQCDDSRSETSIIWYFKDTKSVYRTEIYDHTGKIKHLTNHNKSGNVSSIYTYSYPAPDQMIERLEKGPASRIVTGKSLFKLSPDGDRKEVIMKWHYTVPKEQTLTNENFEFVRPLSNRGYQPYYADVFDRSGLLLERQQLDQNESARAIYSFIYEQNNIVGFDLLDKNRNKISTYSIVGEINPEVVLQSEDHESLEKLTIYKSTNREPIAVIDTGFDIGHPRLVHKWNYSPLQEPIDGVDNDQNGIVDDAYGFSEYYKAPASNNIYERMDFIQNNYIHIPFSHGTHVANIALDGLNQYSLVAYAGEFTNSSFLGKIAKDISKRGIRFVNMSFGFERMKDPIHADKSKMLAMKDLIERNSQTLFFVAAGNTFSDLDKSGTAFYPVAFPDKNVFSIGAIKSSDVSMSDLPSYKIAEFSSQGSVSVDIYCPGYKINSANMGGGFVKVSGTSMASPFCLNLALKIRAALPNLDSLKIKEIMMLTAYIPSLHNPLPCVSGGIVFPERALHAAQLVAGGTDAISAAKSSILKFPVDNFDETNGDASAYLSEWERFKAGRY